MAHRGNRVLCPENTLAAFRQALADGADILETDLHLTADKEFVCIHDATVDRTTNGSGAVVQWESRDFLIAAVDLVLAGEIVEPLPGDQIKEAAGGKVLVYVVMGPGKEPCWRWSDPYRRTLRVHTKQVGTEDA
jgi:glycerophosphoryl diester phosphodiesterase